MVVNKRKKVVKYRGSMTHGGGAKKKRRGAGNRGGRGMAGSGKRADQKKPSIINKYGNTYFGKRGFRRPQKKLEKQEIFNIDDLNKMVENGKLKKEGDLYLVEKGKVLSRGVVKYKFNVKCGISKKAVEKIKSFGGIINEFKKSSS